MLLDGDKSLTPELKAVAKERKSVKLFLGLFLGIPSFVMFVLYLIYPSIFSSHFPGIRASRMLAESMTPTVRKDDSVIINFVSYDRSEPQRGDIVCYQREMGGTLTLNVKRVVAVGGDAISLSGQHITLNGNPVSEPYIVQDLNTNEAPESSDTDLNPSRFKVPANQFFILGDNRENSFDSRYFGPLGRSQIIGKAIYVIRADDPSKRWQKVR